MAFVATAGLITAGIGAVTAIGGDIGKGKARRENRLANGRLQALLNQQTPYSTPQEYFDMKNMAENQAQTGYDAATLNYLTNQQDKSLSTSLGSLAKLGGDPNSVSDIFSRNVDAIMKTSADSELVKLQKFTKVYDTVQGLANQKNAEWADSQARLKDRMNIEKGAIDSSNMAIQANNQTMVSGINTAIGGLANYGTSKLYDARTKALANQPAAGWGADFPVAPNNGAVVTRVADTPLAPLQNLPSYDELLKQWQTTHR